MNSVGGLILGVVLLLGISVACDDTLLVGRAGLVAVGSEGGGAGASASACQPAQCGSVFFACGDCSDNDGDGLTDAADPECLGACQDTEAVFFDAKPAQANRCAQDCYFDGDLGSGNDGCNWPLECDPLRDALSAHGKCTYDPAFVLKMGAISFTCDNLRTAQPPLCASSCLGVTPNGCDCFGCCQPTGLDHAVWLGSEDEAGNATCSVAGLADPTRCRPCTQVPSCLNACEGCEVCFASDGPAPGCDVTQPRCAPNQALCGQAGESACVSGSYCLTGCCVATSASSLGK